MDGDGSRGDRRRIAPVRSPPVQCGTVPQSETVQFNLAKAFDTLVETLADRECIVWRDRRLSYGDVSERSRRLASYLHGRGLGVHRERAELQGWESGQDHVALALYNGNEYLETMIASYRARVAPFNVSFRYVDEELIYLLNDADLGGEAPPGGTDNVVSEVGPYGGV